MGPLTIWSAVTRHRSEITDVSRRRVADDFEFEGAVREKFHSGHRRVGARHSQARAASRRRTPDWVRLLLLLAITALSIPAHACLWDDDTLREEMKGKDRVVEAITGYYDVYPPRYYEMRLERVTRELERDPSRLGDYDNAGVACDRLGRTEEAIAWMARKRDALDKLASSDPTRADHEYRYLSNLGTFHLHRWVQNGMDRARMEDIETAISLIGKAIEENPDAHFGREVFQLRALEWILNPPPRKHESFSMETMLGKEIPEDAANGFAGLITLGTGEDLIDVWLALVAALQVEQHSTLRYLAGCRIYEKIESGMKTLHPDYQDVDLTMVASRNLAGGYQSRDEDLPVLKEWLTTARNAAAKRREVRRVYLEEVMARGQHPDTHPEIWADAPEGPPLPAPPSQWSVRWRNSRGIWVSTLAFGAIGLAILRYIWLNCKTRRRNSEEELLSP